MSGVGRKVQLENLICRAAIDWERKHAEFVAPQTVDPEVDLADVNLKDAVRSYTRYLVEDALDVEGEKKDEDDDD